MRRSDYSRLGKPSRSSESLRYSEIDEGQPGGPHIACNAFLTPEPALFDRGFEDKDDKVRAAAAEGYARLNQRRIAKSCNRRSTKRRR